MCYGRGYPVQKSGEQIQITQEHCYYHQHLIKVLTKYPVMMEQFTGLLKDDWYDNMKP